MPGQAGESSRGWTTGSRARLVSKEPSHEYGRLGVPHARPAGGRDRRDYRRQWIDEEEVMPTDRTEPRDPRCTYCGDVGCSECTPVREDEETEVEEGWNGREIRGRWWWHGSPHSLGVSERHPDPRRGE